MNETDPADVLLAMRGDLARGFPGTGITVTMRTSATSWTFDVAVVSDRADLADRTTREELIARIREVADRMAGDRSVPHADHFERRFAVRIGIHEDYWSDRQGRNSGMAPGRPALLNGLRPGDALEDTATGTVHTVRRNGAKGIQLDPPLPSGPMLPRPRQAAVRTDGAIVRIARGSQDDPDAHHEFRIIRK